MREIDYMFTMLTRAEQPEHVFGKLSGSRDEKLKAIKSQYRLLIRSIHPDFQEEIDKQKATEAFVKLQDMFEKAEKKIKSGTYGHVDFSDSPGAKASGSNSTKSSANKTGGPGRTGSQKSNSSGKSKTKNAGTSGSSKASGSTNASGTKKRTNARNNGTGSGKNEDRGKDSHTLSFRRFLHSGSISDIYEGKMTTGKKKKDVVIKIVRDAGDNDLLERESMNIEAVRGMVKKTKRLYTKFLPEIIDSYALDKDRHLNILAPFKGYYSLGQVMNNFPDGIEPQAMASIMNRLLEILGVVHQNDLVHGAVLPNNILVNPNTNLIGLIDWTAAQKVDGQNYIQLMDYHYKNYYPKAVPNKEPAYFATDIYMTAMCGIALVGGTMDTNPAIIRSVKKNVPKDVRNFLAWMIDPKNIHKLYNAWAIRSEFENIQRKVFKRPAYYPFAMSNAA